MAVLGVDACKGGWVGVRLEPVDEHGRTHRSRASCATTVAELVDLAGPLTHVAIDIPIGLPAAGRRACDVLARGDVGPRRSSVFAAPPRAVLEAASHAEAAARCRQLCGFGISRQAFALAPKILEVDEWVGRADVEVVEAHPEVSFATLAGEHLHEPKWTWAGFQLRRRLLAEAGIILEGDLGLAGQRVASDDVLDAAVVAWSAARVARGEHRTIPDPPEVVAGGRLAAIWA